MNTSGTPGPGRLPITAPSPARLPSIPRPMPPTSSAPPVIVGEMEMGSVPIGSVLAVVTEKHVYTVSMNGPSRGILMTNNERIRNGQIVIHGSWDYDRSLPVWFSLARGKGFLFAYPSDPGDAVRTSPIVKITLSRKGR